MIKVIGVRFRKAGKVYYFDPAQMEIKMGDHVIVETARGIEFGEVVLGVREVDDVFQCCHFRCIPHCLSSFRCRLNRRVIRRRLIRYRGWLRAAPNFISPCSPYRAFSAKVCHTRSAYCEGPLLFPAPLDQTIRVTIDIDYTGTLKNKTFTLENIPLERNKMYLFTLWLLNEDVDISISPDADLDLEELKFNNQITGNDGFWNCRLSTAQQACD